MQKSRLELQELREVEKIMKALANKRRLAIVRFLKKEKRATVSDIARSIELSFKATSKHLSLLASAGILEKEQIGLQMWYRFSENMHHIAKHISNSLE